MSLDPGTALAPSVGNTHLLEGRKRRPTRDLIRAALPSGAALSHDEWARHHRVVLSVLAGCAILVPAYGVLRGYDWLHTVSHTLPLLVLTAVASARRLRRGPREAAAVTGLMTASALAVHGSAGATDAHLMFFALLPLCALYAAWRPFLLAVGLVALHHFAFGLLAPGSVFLRGATVLPLASLHAGFVLVESVACLLAWRLFEDRRDLVANEVVRQHDQLRKLAAAIDATDDAVITAGLKGEITGWNAGAERMYGYRRDEMLGKHFSLLPAPEMVELVAATVNALARLRSVQVDSVHLRKDGSRVPTSLTISNVYDEGGGCTGRVLIARDATDSKRAEEQSRELTEQLQAQAAELHRQSLHDPLTGLGNRVLLRTELDRMTARDAATSGGECSVVALDLDDFKVVNDSLGHATGDAVLVLAAERLCAVVGTAGTVTRLGGDEFAVLLPATNETGAVAVAERILAEFHREFLVLGHRLRTTASVGVAVGQPDEDAGDLLRSADLAMYSAKAAGKGKLAAYRPQMLLDAQQRLDLENHLRHALERDELSLAYQPIVDAATGDLHALEALLRWQHRQWGPVSPAIFIPVAETSGAIVPLGTWVLRTACHDARRLGHREGRPVRVAVNVSVRQLQAPEFVAAVRTALADAGLEPELLTLEITESLLMHDDAATTDVLRELHALGVRLSIDDFGTGHSSLARLRTLPVSELKIDRSFVAEIGPHGECGPIITAIVAMARALGLTVVAEGVETKVQMRALQQLGCDSIQGFLVARPVPLTDLRISRNTFPTVALAAGRSSHLVELVSQIHSLPTSLACDTLDTLVRDALAELVAATGLQTVYLTRVDLAAATQQVLAAHSGSKPLLSEGLVVDWDDTLCKRASETGRTYTSDVPHCFPDSRAAKELGLVTYITAPLRRADGDMVGTLCGASSAAVELSRDQQALVEIFAYVLEPHLARMSPLGVGVESPDAA
jgi:diguanylate cyclase (GGDEF)-like protein/PAS domain S-box-containing protein